MRKKWRGAGPLPFHHTRPVVFKVVQVVAVMEVVAVRRVRLGCSSGAARGRRDGVRILGV